MKRIIPFLLVFGIIIFSSVNADQEISKEASVEEASQLFIDIVVDKALGSTPISAFEILSASYDESQLKLLCDEGSPLCAPATRCTSGSGAECRCGLLRTCEADADSCCCGRGCIGESDGFSGDGN